MYTYKSNIGHGMQIKENRTIRFVQKLNNEKVTFCFCFKLTRTCFKYKTKKRD